MLQGWVQIVEFTLGGRHGFSLIGFLGNMQVSGSKERERVSEEVAVHEQYLFSLVNRTCGRTGGGGKVSSRNEKFL
jgi:hypothetical protein